LQGLTALQKFLQLNLKISVNELDSLFLSQPQQQSPYNFLDSFVSYLTTDRRLSPNTVSLYMAAVKGYLEHCEINPRKFKNKVTMPRNHREDETAIDDKDMRKILLACNNSRLKVYLLILASGGLRAREATAIRIKDIDFTITPTKIHVRKEYTKTKVARDVYISEEATSYLKQFIEKKYSTDSLSPQIKEQQWNDRRLRNEHADDLVFRMYNPNESRPNDLYTKLLVQFQRVLKTVGLAERKDGMQRRKITFHSFRRFCKTVITMHTSTDYSEWFLGHSKSPYFVLKELTGGFYMLQTACPT
jgi:integrase